MYITVPEGSTRHSLAVRLVDDPVSRAPVRAAGPPLNHVAAVDDVQIFQGRDLDPFLLALMPHLQAVFTGLLEQDGDAAKVCMGPDAELTLADLAVRWVADHLHRDDGPLGELIHQGWRLAETLEQNGPKCLSQLASLLIIPPDWSAEVLFREVGPNIGTVDARELHDWILPAHEEALEEYQ